MSVIKRKREAKWRNKAATEQALPCDLSESEGEMWHGEEDKAERISI